MATAKTYDKYFDAGLSFSSDEVTEYEPTVQAKRFANRLLHAWRLCKRHSEIDGLERPVLWNNMASVVLDSVTWTCTAMELGWNITKGSETDELMPKRGTKEWKALNKEASSVEADEFIDGLLAEMHQEIMWVTTIGRASKSAGIADKWAMKRNNKLVNCYDRFIRNMDKIKLQSASRVRKTV